MIKGFQGFIIGIGEQTLVLYSSFTREEKKEKQGRERKEEREERERERRKETCRLFEE